MLYRVFNSKFLKKDSGTDGRYIIDPPNEIIDMAEMKDFAGNKISGHDTVAPDDKLDKIIESKFENDIRKIGPITSPDPDEDVIENTKFKEERMKRLKNNSSSNKKDIMPPSDDEAFKVINEWMLKYGDVFLHNRFGTALTEAEFKSVNKNLHDGGKINRGELCVFVGSDRSEAQYTWVLMYGISDGNITIINKDNSGSLVQIKFLLVHSMPF